MSPSVLRTITKRVGSSTLAVSDELAVEEPLEIRVDGETLAVTMRTPKEDARLAMGFLLAEGLIESRADIGSIAPCGRPGDEDFGNVLDVRSAPGRPIAIERILDSRRYVPTTAARGVCGRRSIEHLRSRLSVVKHARTLTKSQLLSAVAALPTLQPLFSSTGGVHAAALFSADRALVAFEDVGRHNAVDKAVGWLVERDALGSADLLVVSSRSSFEIVQKAAAARIPVVASVSAPSSLAVDLAHEFGITLVGFVRGDSLNVYSHPDRMVD